jgi:branched-chain amino acid transport system ATP-binding protein
MKLLEVEQLVTYYDSIAAVRHISFDVLPGEIVALIGSNGAGKTTTLNTLSGIVAARAGSILLAGERMDRLPAHRVAALGIIQVPEGRRIFSRMTVLENLQMGAVLRRDQRAIREDRDYILSLFPRLRERLRQLAGLLSGGEQQMLAIGRALMARPRIMLIDEPSMGLAPLFVREIFDALVQLNLRGMTMLIAEQNAHMALSIAHRAYVMQNGQVTQTGTGQQLRADPAIIRAYLGG